jgi:fructose-bisphosphate aldolase class I
MRTAKFLWEQKRVVPFLKIDKGLAEEKDGVQMMKPMPELDKLLDKGVKAGIFGTKERSLIKEANEAGIKAIAAQQFEVGLQVLAKGMVPILEPEVDINSKDKAKCEDMLLAELLAGLAKLKENQKVMFKLTIPTKANLYKPLMEHANTIRVVALSGGYNREDSCKHLSANNGMIASFSRAFAEGMNAKQTDEEFNALMDKSCEMIYQASRT